MGQVVYKVNERPVTVAQGSIPSYRDLAQGAQGVDVRQLEAFLKSEGYLGAAADTRFTATTTAAVKRWQRRAGIRPASGVVRAGDLVFTTTLPARAVLAKPIRVGLSLVGGEEALDTLGSAPKFILPLDDVQATLAVSGTTVRITKGNSIWEATIGPVVQKDAAKTATLKPTSDKPICLNKCDSLSATKDTVLAAEVILVPTTPGVAIPSAAIGADAAGSSYVLDEAGERHAVTVQAADAGISIVTGIEAGLTVRIPQG